MIKEDELKILIGAFLHDIGKFWQRASKPLDPEFSKLEEKEIKHSHSKWSGQFIKSFKSLITAADEVLELALYHAKPAQDNIEQIVIKIADEISSSERTEEKEYFIETKPHTAPLFSIFRKLYLLEKYDDITWSYKLAPITLNKNIFFPQRASLLPETSYPELANAFEEELNNIKSVIGEKNISFNTLFYLCYKFLWRILSAPKNDPDVSLFDHLKTSAAITICLYKNPFIIKSSDSSSDLNLLRQALAILKSNSQLPEKGKIVDVIRTNLFLIISGDLSGIQNFIYEIAQSESAPGVSKRLRGRSFYISIMMEVFARYILRELELPITNLFYCGGGRFDIVAPYTEIILEKFERVKSEINQFLFNKFKGKLSLILETLPVNCQLMDKFNEVLQKISDKLEEAKKKKFISRCNADLKSFIHTKNPDYEIKVCEACEWLEYKPAESEEPVCDECKLHKEIGSWLPKIDAIAFASGEIKIYKSTAEYLPISFDKLGVVYLIKRLTETIEIDCPSEIEVEVDLINSTEDFWKIADISKPNISAGFKFIPQIVPVAKTEFKPDNRDESYKEGDVLDFETIAQMSQGDERLGILKMDVDRLGLILALGLGEDRTPSRLSTLSRTLDLFFTGYINNICQDYAREYASQYPNYKFKDETENIFYITYSGGDDLLIVGPWSEIPKLAQKIRNEFTEYTCFNPNITISAGIFLCKPKFPVKRFAPLCNIELEKSKHKGKNRLTFFGDTVLWTSDENNGRVGFDKLIEFAEELYNFVEQPEASTDKMPRGFLHKLLYLRKYFKDHTGAIDLNFIPALVFQIERNLKGKSKEEVKKKLITCYPSIEWFEKIGIPASYALLKSRK